MSLSKKASGSADKLGTKHVCFSCGTKFYDMKKKKAICPRCGADQADAPAKPAKKESGKGTGKKTKSAPKPRDIESSHGEVALDIQGKGENEVYLDEAFADDLVDDEDDDI